MRKKVAILCLVPCVCVIPVCARGRCAYQADANGIGSPRTSGAVLGAVFASSV